MDDHCIRDEKLRMILTLNYIFFPMSISVFGRTCKVQINFLEVDIVG